jgi:acyl-CoA reductase-like NAD-dependent aldehyde dehydrogenase
VLPALLAGNAVIQKPSPQTPLVAERMQQFYEKAGLPEGLLQTIHLGTLSELESLVSRPEISHVAFTGSVAGGLAVQKAAMNSFKGRDPNFLKLMRGVCLELGGKDAAYVRADADILYSAVEIADGAAFNSGQSCCAIERVYVHKDVYDSFVTRIVDELKGYKLGDPNGTIFELFSNWRYEYRDRTCGQYCCSCEDTETNF